MKFIYNSGQRPLDGYTLKRGIGRGGFGEVYYAVSDSGREVQPFFAGVCRLLALSGQSSRTCICPLLNQSGHATINYRSLR